MKTLPLDVSRCSGRRNFDPDGLWCPEHESCQRYQALVFWDKAAGVTDYKGVGVTMAVANCQMKIDVLEVSA